MLDFFSAATFMFTFETTNVAVSEADEAAEVCVNLVSMANLAAVEPINVDIIVSGDGRWREGGREGERAAQLCSLHN